MNPLENEFSLSAYDYSLPKELIASYPIFPKEKARLLVYDRKNDSIVHTDFYRFFDHAPKDALVVLNDTKVVKARLFGHKESGGVLEVLFHREAQNGLFLCSVRGRVKEGDRIVFERGYEAITKKILKDGLREIAFFLSAQRLDLKGVFEMLQAIGHVPIPPYVKRRDEDLDALEYQSVFARNCGAIAAPTASLHFSDAAAIRLKSEFEHCLLTLHVGAGTFASVETSDVRDHRMHSESLMIPSETMKKIDFAKKILCIGTTSLRSVEYYKRLEGFDESKDLFAECDVFLHPGNPVKYVDFLLTNFHLPKSSLIMLVASMIGLKKCREIYEIAIQEGYRFYSYGDGMLIL